LLSNTTYKLEKINPLQIFERISDAFFALDNDFNYVYLNKAAIALHEVPAETLLGNNIWELYPELVGGDFYKALYKSKETQQTQQNEFYHAHTERWYIDSIYPDENGLSIYYSDITETKKAKETVEKSEEALKLSNERFEYLAKATKDVIWDWDIEHDILKGDEKYCNLFDIAIGETINFSTFQHYIHPNDRERINRNYDNAVKNKQPLLTEEFIFIKKDGSEKVINDRAYIFYNDDGVACRMIGAMQDITELKAIEKKLIEEKDVSDSIINSLPGVFYLFNKEGKYLRVILLKK
jgi:PAS domain S-box-containing protein